MKNNVIEQWRTVPGYGSKYEVSCRGRVRRILADGSSKIRVTPIDSNGYLKVNLSGGGARTVRVHRLVAECFLPNPRGLPVVHHRNADKTDNRVENLEWTTHYRNNRHAIRSGCVRTKLSWMDVDAIRTLGKKKIKRSHIAAMFRVSSGHISEVINSERSHRMRMEDDLRERYG